MRRRVRVTMLAMIFLGVPLVAVTALFGYGLLSARTVPKTVSVGKLAACPAAPNCVSTQEDDRSHWIAPLKFGGSAADVIPRLREIVSSMSGSVVVTQNDTYLHAEFRSAVFRFVDDVEFLVEPESARVHLRSASRVGHSDFGVNRARVEEIRRRFHGPAPR